MAAADSSARLKQYVDDELMRAPMLFDQVVDGTLAHARDALPKMSPSRRAEVGDLMQTLPILRRTQSEYFVRSLRDQVAAAAGAGSDAGTPRKATRSDDFELVDEDQVALDVELSHTIEAIRSVAEYELRELQTFTSALVGDMDVAQDHNPFRAETYARAMWAAAQALPVSRGLQAAFMHHAATPLAQVLRRSYAAATSRLEAMGVEPAAYRTLILPAGSRRGRPDSTGVPDLQRIRETMPAPLEMLEALGPPAARVPVEAPRRRPGADVGREPQQAAQHEHWSVVARTARRHVDRQGIELVSRLFDAIFADERVPHDIALLISRLHGPAMRLALRDPALLDRGEHPLWCFVNRLCFAAEMSPDAADPERVQLLRVAQATIDQLASEPEQTGAVYRWALERLDQFLAKRLARRVAALSSQIGALQKLEEKLGTGGPQPTTMHGTLDVQQLATVPADLLDSSIARAMHVATQADDFLADLKGGDWVRIFLQGRWVHAQLVWPGEKREIWLFGDGATDAHWAVRRGALVTLFDKGLLKPLLQRSIVASAAVRVQDEVASGASTA